VLTTNAIISPSLRDARARSTWHSDNRPTSGLNRDRRRLEQAEARMATIALHLADKALSKQDRIDYRLHYTALEEKDDLLTQRILATYGKLLLHEKPKLQSVEVKGNQQGPLYHEVDLSRLSREDLLALARILPKLGGAPIPEEPKKIDRK
jgi:hypothetical protein